MDEALRKTVTRFTPFTVAERQRLLRLRMMWICVSLKPQTYLGQVSLPERS